MMKSTIFKFAISADFLAAVSAFSKLEKDSPPWQSDEHGELLTSDSWRQKYNELMNNFEITN